MKILIIGICGFVGSSLAERLVEQIEGLSVYGIDNLMRSATETNRLRLRKLGITRTHGDIRATSDRTLGFAAASMTRSTAGSGSR